MLATQHYQQSIVNSCHIEWKKFNTGRRSDLEPAYTVMRSGHRVYRVLACMYCGNQCVSDGITWAKSKHYIPFPLCTRLYTVVLWCPPTKSTSKKSVPTQPPIISLYMDSCWGMYLVGRHRNFCETCRRHIHITLIITQRQQIPLLSS